MQPRTSAGPSPSYRRNTVPLSRSRSTLRDLYRRVPSTSSGESSSRSATGATRTESPTRRGSETLKDRYSRRLDRDVRRVTTGTGAGTTPRPTETHRGGTSIRAGSSGGRAPTRSVDSVRAGSTPSSTSSGRTASHRYPTPSARPRSVDGTATRTTTHRLAGVTPLQPRGTATSPRLTTSPRTVTTPRLINRGDYYSANHYHPRSYYNPRSYFAGYTSWYSHNLALGFCFGYTPGYARWGLYSYPYNYCVSLANWNYGYRSRFSFFWNNCYGWNNYYVPWWRRSYYCPSVYTSHYVYDDFGTGTYYPASYTNNVVVIEGESAGSNDEEIIVGAEPAATQPTAPVSSRASLAEHHVSLGDFYFAEERFEEAAESYLRALAYAPEDPTIHFVLADALFATGDYHYAAFMIGKGLRLDPELAQAETDKRTFYQDPETFEKQLAKLRDYVTAKPFDAAAHLVLGYNLKFSADPVGAEAAFRRVLEIEPNHESAPVFLEALRLPAAAPASPGTGKKPEPKAGETTSVF